MDETYYKFTAFLIINLGILFSLIGISSEETTEFCASESFDHTCSENQALLIQSALYGRMKPGRCISSEYAHSIGCFADVLQYMDSQCSGRQTCKLLIANLEAVAQPCFKDFKSYLQIKYTCVEVAAVKPENCHQDQEITLSDEAGIIAIGTIDYGLISLQCQWTINAKRGQNILLKLLTFDLLSMDDWSYANEGMQSLCTVDIFVTENGEKQKVDICDIKQREKQIFKSKSNYIYIEVSSWKQSYHTPRFMIEYRAVGCPDIIADSGTWVSRSGDHLFVRCNETNETWFLTCKGQRWIGEVGNCSTSREWTYEQILGNSGPFHRGWIVFAIIIGIVLGLLVGTSLLTVALMWRKRRRSSSISVKSSKDQRPDLYNETDISRIPAYLHTEKNLGDVSEYTHVWEVHPPMACIEGHHTHNCKMTDIENRSLSNEIAYWHRDNTYSRRKDDNPVYISRTMPVFFDLENQNENKDSNG